MHENKIKNRKETSLFGLIGLIRNTSLLDPLLLLTHLFKKIKTVKTPKSVSLHVIPAHRFSYYFTTNKRKEKQMFIGGLRDLELEVCITELIPISMFYLGMNIYLSHSNGKRNVFIH